VTVASAKLSQAQAVFALPTFFLFAPQPGLRQPSADQQFISLQSVTLEIAQ
jgi:hypothetical protein